MKLSFALCSDTHGKSPPFFLYPNITAVLHAGDIYDAPNLAKPGDRLQPLREWIKHINLPVFAVRGNHDFLDRAHFFTQFGDLTGRVKLAAPKILIAGLGLAFPTYFDMPTNRDLLDPCSRILIEARKLKTPTDRFILLTHYPVPALSKPNSPHAYESIAKLLTELETTVNIPILAIIEGHIHEWFNTTDQHCIADHRIPIYRPGPAGAILQIDDETWEVMYKPEDG